MINWENLGTAVMGNTVPYNTNDQSRIITSVKAGFKKLDWLRICRIPLSFNSSKGAFPGHYWIEIIHEKEDMIDQHIRKAREEKKVEQEIIALGNVQSANGFRESYGWYPIALPVTITPNDNPYSTSDIPIGRIEIKEQGIINGASDSRIAKDASKYRDHTTERDAGREIKKKDEKTEVMILENNLSIYPFDPHQSSRFREGEIKMVSHPYLFPRDNRTKDEIIEEIRKFASSFSSDHSALWSWCIDGYSEVNCHTFLFLLLGKLELADPIIAEDKDDHFRRYFKIVKSNNFSNPKRLELLTKLDDISKELKENYEYYVSY